MNNDIQREMSVLKALWHSDEPLGAIYLSEMLNIPPATVGRVLAKLEEKGLARKESNKGRSITVKGTKYLRENISAHSRMDAAYNIINDVNSSNIESLTETLNIRKLLEGYAAMLCAENCTKEDIAVLEEIQKEYMHSLSENDSGSDLDLKLHLQIADFSKNNTLKNILRLLLTDNSRYKIFSQAAVYQNRLWIKEHQKIIDAIKEKDPKKAKTEMEKHLDRVMRNINDCI